MPPLGGDEEVKEGKRIKNFNSKHLFPRFRTLSAQIKARNNSKKLKCEIRQILYLLYQHNKSPKKFHQVIIIMGMYIDVKKLVITETKTFPFHFDLLNDVGKNLKHETEFIIKHNEH